MHSEVNNKKVCLVKTTKGFTINLVVPHNLKEGRLSVCLIDFNSKDLNSLDRL